MSEHNQHVGAESSGRSVKRLVAASPKWNWGIASVLVLVIVVIGIKIIFFSHAGSTSTWVSAEAESGTRTGTTTIVADSNASGGQYVQFGTNVLPSPTPTPAVTPTPTPGSGGTDFTAVGTIFDSNNGAGSGMGGVNSVTINPQHVGDLLVLADQVDLDNGIGGLTSVTGTGTSGWTKLTDITDGGGYVALWAGTATATGSTKLTLGYSGSLSGSDVEYTVQEFQAPNGWALDVAKAQYNNSSSTTVAAPTLTPTSAVPELYVAYGAVLGTGGFSAQTGWTYQITASGYQNVYMYNTNVTAATAPTGAKQSPAGSSTVLAGLIKP